MLWHLALLHNVHLLDVWEILSKDFDAGNKGGELQLVVIGSLWCWKLMDSELPLHQV